MWLLLKLKLPPDGRAVTRICWWIPIRIIIMTKMIKVYKSFTRLPPKEKQIFRKIINKPRSLADWRRHRNPISIRSMFRIVSGCHTTNSTYDLTLCIRMGTQVNRAMDQHWCKNARCIRHRLAFLCVASWVEMIIFFVSFTQKTVDSNCTQPKHTHKTKKIADLNVYGMLAAGPSKEQMNKKNLFETTNAHWSYNFPLSLPQKPLHYVREENPHCLLDPTVGSFQFYLN